MTGLKDELLDYIQKTDHVSFAELCNHFDGHFSGGNFAIEVRHNVPIWAGMSQDACDAIRSMLNDELIFCAPTTTLIYLIDGRSLSLPIAKRLRPYTKPHWLPVILRPIAHLKPIPKHQQRTLRQ